MAKITEPGFTVGISKTPLGYSNAKAPDFSPIGAGIQRMGAAYMQLQAEQKQKQENVNRFKAVASLSEFQNASELRLQERAKTAPRDDATFATTFTQEQLDEEHKFIQTLPPDLQEEFKARVVPIRGSLVMSAHKVQDDNLDGFYKQKVSDQTNQSVLKLADDPTALQSEKDNLHAMIDNSGISQPDKEVAHALVDRNLETQAYRSTYKKNRMTEAQYSNDLVTSTQQLAKEIGADPTDLLTIFSYETGGTFSADQKGGKDGVYKGLIQFSPENQKKYGIYDGMPVGEQVKAVGQYLKDRGYKPGMSLTQLYATINAGSPDNVNASDAHNGGMPGTVTDKVANQFGAHRENAVKLANGKYAIPDTMDEDPQFHNVLYEDRVAARNAVDSSVAATITQMNADRKTAESAFTNNFLNSVASGTAGPSEFEQAIEAGHFNDYDDRKKVQDLFDKKVKDGATLRTFMNRVENNYALDPNDTDNKKSMNLWYSADKGEAALQARDQSYVTDKLVPLFQKTGMLPSDAVGVLGAMARSADGRAMTYAYQALSVLEETNPAAYAAQVDEGTRKKADLYEAMRGVLPEKELLEWARESPSAEIRQAMVNLREDAKRQLDKSDAKVTFDSVLSSFGADAAVEGPKSAAMENEWRLLVEENYARGGGISIETANELATKQLKQKWGVSNLGGKATLMRRPPESLYPAVAGSHDWIDTQARGELGLMPDEKYILVPDSQTEVDIANKAPASYAVLIDKGNGLEPAYGYEDAPIAQRMIHETNLDPVPSRRVMKRIYFQPTEEDSKLHQTDTLVKNKEAELAYYSQFVTPTGRTAMSAPPDVVKEYDRVKAELETLKGIRSSQEEVSKVQYDTPAQQKLIKLQKQIAPLNAELSSWTDPVEQWPKAKAWEKLHDEIAKLQPEAAKEVQMKRRAGGVSNAAN